MRIRIWRIAPKHVEGAYELRSLEEVFDWLVSTNEGEVRDMVRL